MVADLFSQLEKSLNVYEFEDHLLSNEEMVFSFKPMTIAQIKRCLQCGENEEKLEAVLDEIIKENVKINSKPIDDPLDLYLEDRFWILFNIRLKSRGESLESNFKCTKCNQIIPIDVDLTHLEKKYGNIKAIQEQIQLGDGSIYLKMDWIRRKDLIAFNEYVKQQQKQEETETDFSIENVISFYALMIKEIKLVYQNENPPKAPIVKNDLSIEEKIRFLEMLSEIDYEKIRKWVEENSFGVKLTLKVQCPICKTETEEELNIGNFF